MKKKFRFIMYGVLIAFAVLSQLMWIEGPLWEPISFIALVLIAAGAIEIYSYKKGLK